METNAGGRGQGKAVGEWPAYETPSGRRKLSNSLINPKVMLSDMDDFIEGDPIAIAT